MPFRIELEIVPELLMPLVKVAIPTESEFAGTSNQDAVSRSRRDDTAVADAAAEIQDRDGPAGAFTEAADENTLIVGRVSVPLVS